LDSLKRGGCEIPQGLNSPVRVRLVTAWLKPGPFKSSASGVLEPCLPKTLRVAAVADGDWYLSFREGVGVFECGFMLQ
jgi:hypothetical protein